ncbi:MAG: hypothetical protein ABEJ86_03800 [Halococcoides sp.]
MARTPDAIGVEDPYAHVQRCDHLTDDGRCRLAATAPDVDAAFTRRLRERDFRCPFGDPATELTWRDCPELRRRERSTTCARCGLEERRDGLGEQRPLLEAHHLVYPDGDGPDHEITVTLCRWCHATVHDSWGAIEDDVAPDPEAIAEREHRIAREASEADFETAAERDESGIEHDETAAERDESADSARE